MTAPNNLRPFGRHLLVACLLIVAAGSFVLAQKTTPTPTPTPAQEDVVKISTDLVQVDVSVTDDRGRPVTDLKQDEIEIYENGQKQKITGFNFVSNVRQVAEQAKPVEKNGIPIPVPSRTLRPESIHRTIALVVDDLSLSWESVAHTRSALKKFVDEQMQDGDLVAIIRTGAGIGALQQFTSDKRLLYAAIEKVKWNPNGTGGISAFAPISTDPNAEPTPDPDAGDIPTGDISLDEFRNGIFATGTLGALKYIISGMGQLPGRKAVILFSDGFKLLEEDTRGFKTPGRVMNFMTALVDAANRAAVTFYTIDSRGLEYTGPTAADSIGASPEAYTAAIDARQTQLQDTQGGLQYLAHETGGFAVLNNNDLAGGVRRVLNDQSYYLVAYDPESDTFDAKNRRFNKLTVKVLRPGVHVRYRSGFFNVTDTAQAAAAAAPTNLSPVQQLQQALISPFGVTGIDLRMNAVYGDDPKDGPFVHSLLHVNAKDLNFNDEKDGLKKASIEILAMAFGDNGQVVDKLAKGYDITISRAKYQELVKTGFVYEFTFPVKKPGAYQYRVAIRDAIGGSVGSASQFIQVPDLKKKGLTVSSLVIQSVTADQWKALMAGTDVPMRSASTDTALRRITTGVVLRYAYEIYNAKLDGTKQPQLSAHVRIFRDGKLFYEGTDAPIDVHGQTDLQHIKSAGALALGKTLEAGDYVLQVVVTDKLAKQKRQISTQFIEFEVVP